jgi:ATP:ADP antiporter, AAA family
MSLYCMRLPLEKDNKFDADAIRHCFRSNIFPSAEDLTIRKYLLRLLSLQEEEAPSALPMILFFFLTMACVGIIKPLSTSLCLCNIGLSTWKYPILYACLALLAGPIAVLFQYLTKRLAHTVLLIGTVGIFLLTFILFYFVFLRSHATWVSYAFYAWGGLLNLLIPTLGWVISYDLYNIREAKRFFGLLATGGALGGAVGSLSAFLSAGSWIEEQVLLCLVILEGTAVLLYQSLRRRADQGSRRVPSSRETGAESLHSLKSMLRQPYIRCMAGLVLLAALATTLVDLNYQWFLKRRFPEQKELTQVLAIFLAALYILSACVNLFGTQRILKKLGLPALLLVSPVALGSTSVCTALFARFWPAVAVKALGGVLSPSLHRTGVEMLYVPLASRKGTLPLKSFIDLAVFKIGDCLGAVLFAILVSFLAFPVQMAAVLQIITITAWGFLALRIGKEYVRHLRHSVQEGMAVRLAATPEHGMPEENLVEALRSSDPVKIRLALIGLRQLYASEEDSPPPFPYDGENVMQTNMSAISPAQNRWMASAASLLNHQNPEVGAAALNLLVRHDPVRQLRLLRAKLDSEWLPSPVYICYVDQYIEQPGGLLNPTNVLRWCQNLSGDELARMARVMGKSRNRAFLPILRQWTQQNPGSGTLAAIEAIGRFAEPRFLQLLCSFLGSYWSRKAARKALSFYGEAVVPYLQKVIQDPHSDPKISREIPLILGSVRCSSSRTVLFSALYNPDPVISYRALQALNRIRETQDLSYAAGSFQPVVEFWARQFYSLINLESIHKSNGPCGKLLARVLEERKRNLVEKIFRTLDLFLPRGDAHYCYRVITEGRQDLRDHAIELIDSQLNPVLKGILLPLLSDSSCANLAREGRKLFNLADTADAIVSEALIETDPWMRSCILAAIRDWPQPTRVAFESVQRYCNDANALVRETAQWVLEGLRSSAPHRNNQNAQNN